MSFERRMMKLSGWGRYPVIDALAPSFETEGEAADLLAGSGHWIARGLGKSYGDSALNRQVLRTDRFNKFLDFDASRGTVTCEGGVSLAEIIDHFLPRGWFLQVTPGTKLITVGGAIASDVHGKNHHTAGCFSESVVKMRIMLADGRTIVCSPKENQALFRATCGGMGLTGLILDATLQLQPVRSANIRETVIRCANLAESFEQFEKYQQTSYSVAWIDCLAKGQKLGRSVLMVGEHAEDGDLQLPAPRPHAIPVTCPGFLLNRYSVSLFNALYYSTHPSRPDARTTSLDAFFYPLDSIAHWNRMYGNMGFTQYQFVLPRNASYPGLCSILKKIADTGIGSFLAVLKLLGPQNDNPLSFPMAGHTLALDFKIEPRLFPLLDELDRMVLDHGGRLYLTKDVRMSREMFDKGYPQKEAFTALRRKYDMPSKFNSLQSRRLGI